MAKFKPQKARKGLSLDNPLSDSEQEPDDYLDGDDVLPGSDSSDDVMDDDDDSPQQQQQLGRRDIAALAAAAQQQAAHYAARQKKQQQAAAAGVAAAAEGLGDEDDEEDEGLDSEMEGGSSEEEEEDEEGAGPGSKRPRIYNTDALHEKLEDIAWIDEQPWRESLVITSAQPTHVEDIDDDLERELAFYNQALSATSEAINRFQSEGTPWLRPPDYYAEMVKSDEQMARIKDKLMYEQQQIDQATERRKAREQKAYAKQVQAEKQKERAQEKKRQIQQVQQLRKQREKSGFAGELDFDAEMNKQQGGRGAGQQQQQQRKGVKPGQRFNPNDRTIGKKRQLKNAKFGFGGKKRLQKQNDAFSAADMSGYKPGRFDGEGGGGGGNRRGGGRGGGGGFKGGMGAKGGVKKGGAGGGGNRPGKARRQQQRQRSG